MKVRPNPESDGVMSHTDLTPGNIYRVIELVVDDFRVMNDQGIPYLYPMSFFTVVDDQWPDDWIIRLGGGGERYVSPSCFADFRFFERYFDGEKEAVSIFRQRLRKWGAGKE